MTFRKLFATVGAAALLAGGAHAATQALGDVNANVGDAIESSTQCFAAETDTGVAGSTAGFIELAITSTAVDFDDNNGVHTLTINLGGGATFSGSAVQPFVNGAAPAGSTVSANLDINAFNPSTLPVAGGTTAVYTFDVSSDSAPTDVLGLRIPVNFTSATTGTVNAQISTTGSTVLVFAPTALNAGVAQDAFGITVASDVTTTITTDSQINSSAQQNFAVVGADGALQARIGTVTPTFTAGTCAGGAVFESVNAISTAGTSYTGLAGTVDLTYTSTGTLPTGGVVGQGATTGAPPTGGVALGALESDASAVGFINVALPTGNTNTIAVQTISAAGSLNLPAGLVDEAIASTDLDPLDLTGASDGPFEWFGDSTVGRQNFLRCTGFGTTVQDILVTTSNVKGANGTTSPFVVSGASIGRTPSATETTFTINSSDIETAVGGAFGNLDINSVTFVGSPNTLECDRLMSSPADKVVSSFGNTGSED